MRAAPTRMKRARYILRHDREKDEWEIQMNGVAPDGLTPLPVPRGQLSFRFPTAARRMDLLQLPFQLLRRRRRSCYAAMISFTRRGSTPASRSRLWVNPPTNSAATNRTSVSSA